MTSTYHATLLTEHGPFTACGASAAQARDAVLNSWAARAAAHGLDAARYGANDVQTARVVLGQGYLDGRPIGAGALASGPNTARIKRDGGQRS